MVKYLSLFSGVEAASVAWEPLGWEPMAFAEIEPFPSAVLAARFPTVPNLGDVTAVDWPAWKAQHGSPDVIVAGSPCQAFSVAGKRLSLEDARGNLSLFTAELVRFLNPRVFIWENVPGALSTKDNAFGCLLGDIVGADAPIVPPGKRWTGAGMVAGPERVAAWRILDAQYFGVAQRRRRIFLVACPIGGADPAEILFELEGVRRDTPPSRQPREGTATEPEGGAGSGCWWDGGDLAGTITTKSDTQRMHDKGNFQAVVALTNAPELFEWHGQDTRGKGPLDVCPTVAAKYGTGGGNTPLVTHGYRKSARAQSKDGYETWVADGVANTVNCFDVGDIRSTTVAVEPSCLASGHANAERTKGYSPTITRQNDGPPVVFDAISSVRRLTPIETERLQGFPDNWTAIEWRGKTAEDCPDSHRYKAMGNSMAVPVMRWLGARIDAVLNGKPFQHGIPERCRADIELRNGAPPAASEPTVMAPAFSKRPGQQIANRSDGLCYAVTTGQPPSVVCNG